MPTDFLVSLSFILLSLNLQYVAFIAVETEGSEGKTCYFTGSEFQALCLLPVSEVEDE